MSVKFDLLDALTEFANLRLFRVIQKNILRSGIVQIDLADERTLGVVEMATFGLNDPPGFSCVFLLPFRDDVVVSLDFKQTFEDQREALRGRFLEREHPDVVIVEAKMSPVAFEMRLA